MPISFAHTTSYAAISPVCSFSIKSMQVFCFYFGHLTLFYQFESRLYAAEKRSSLNIPIYHDKMEVHKKEVDHD